MSDKYCVYDEAVAVAISPITQATYEDIKLAIATYPDVGFIAMLSMLAHKAATIATNAALGKPLDRMWSESPDPEYAPRPEARARNAALEEAANACENIYAGDEAPGDWPTPEQCAAAIRKLKLSTPRTPRDSALDEIEKLIAAIEGRHFAAIGTAASEDDKRRHGTKAAFAMELRAAIRALKSEPPMNSGSK